MSKRIEGCGGSVFYYVDGWSTSIEKFAEAEPIGFPEGVLRYIGKDTLERVQLDIQNMKTGEDND